jgi:hypothetical protein
MHRFLVAALGSLVALVACVSDVPDPTCPEYCNAILKECKDADAQYVTTGGDPMPSCLAICGKFPLSRDAGSNSIACRKTAISSASELTGAMHHARCLDAGPFSDMCGGVVQNFCHLETALCPGNPYANEGTCLTAFPMIAKDNSDVMTVNDPAVPTQNSKLCRFYHIEKATEDPVLHCPHTNAPVSPICVN